jgi:uncharacterized protein YbcV (DUF1398 family)
MPSTDPIAIVRAALARADTDPRAAAQGFPFRAATLRAAGVAAYHVDVPGRATLYDLAAGSVLEQDAPLRGEGLHPVAPFDEAGLVAALHANQAGRSTYADFVEAALRAGVVRYDVDLAARTCTYRGAAGEAYTERYPAVAA